MFELDQFFLLRRNASQPVIAALSAKFKKGSVTAICGANGSGKTSFLEAISGQEGFEFVIDSAKIGGKTLDILHTQDVLYLPQTQNFVPHDTVQTFLEYLTQDLPKKGSFNQTTQNKNLLNENLNLFGTAALFEKQLSQLSAGQWKRVQCTAHFSRFCLIRLLDEPEAALDAQGLMALVQSLQQARKRGETILLVSHHFEFLKRIADEILVFEHGNPVWSSDFKTFCRLGPREIIDPFFQK